MNAHTEVEFTLPHGYVARDGNTYRHGHMRMATALDEVESVAHPRVQANEAYLPIVLLSRVITHLGSLNVITAQMMERLFAADIAYLEDLYIQLNSYDGIVVQTRCPHCNSGFSLRVIPSPEGE
jgi:hypothetical protein